MSVSTTVTASPDAVYAAFLDPDALLAWLPPRPMTGHLHGFYPRQGGGYDMSLYYPETDQAHRGKTAAREDRVGVHFIKLESGRRIIEAVRFETTDPAFKGEMTIEIAFEPVAEGTRVTVTTSNLPPGIRPEDHDEGTRISLRQLAERFAKKD